MATLFRRKKVESGEGGNAHLSRDYISPLAQRTASSFFFFKPEWIYRAIGEGRRSRRGLLEKRQSSVIGKGSNNFSGGTISFFFLFSAIELGVVLNISESGLFRDQYRYRYICEALWAERENSTGSLLERLPLMVASSVKCRVVRCKREEEKKLIFSHGVVRGGSSWR